MLRSEEGDISVMLESRSKNDIVIAKHIREEEIAALRALRINTFRVKRVMRVYYTSLLQVIEPRIKGNIYLEF